MPIALRAHCHAVLILNQGVVGSNPVGRANCEVLKKEGKLRK